MKCLSCLLVALKEYEHLCIFFAYFIYVVLIPRSSQIQLASLQQAVARSLSEAMEKLSRLIKLKEKLKKNYLEFINETRNSL